MDSVLIRDARRDDCIRIRELIQELADYEKMPHGPKINAATLEIDGFDASPPLYHCLVAEDTESGNVIGYALYYLGYSTWQGKRFCLEDIMVSPDQRRKRIGTKLFQRICSEALRVGCNVMNFNVLGWNPAVSFYSKFSALDLTKEEDWHYYTLKKEDFLRIAKNS